MDATNAKLSALYSHSGSFVPTKHDAEGLHAHDAHTDAQLAREEAVAHLARVRRERRMTAPAGPRARSKLEEIMDRADANAKIQLSLSDILAGQHVAPFTLREKSRNDGHAPMRHDGHAPLRHTESEPLSAEITPPSSGPRTPATPKKKAGAASYLHDSPSGVSLVSPHFTGTHHDDTEPLPAWLHSSAPASTRKPAKELRRRATSEGISASKSAEAEAVRAHIADLRLREECEAAARIMPKQQKKTPLAAIKTFVKAVKSKIPSRAKRSLKGDFQ